MTATKAQLECLQDNLRSKSGCGRAATSVDLDYLRYTAVLVKVAISHSTWKMDRL